MDEKEWEVYIAKVKKTSYAAGRREGEMLKLISQVQKKMKKGQSPGEIAENLEETLELVRLVYEMVEADPDGTREVIYQRMNN